MKRVPSSKGRKQVAKQNFNNNKQRSQSSGIKNHVYKNNNNYDDDLTKKFMSPTPNDYNGYANNKDQNGNFVSPTFEIENLYLSNVSTDVANYKNVVKQANKKNIKITNPNVGDKFSIGEAECEIMSAENKKDTTPNNSSIVIEMNYKGEKFLFMGDAEKEIEQSRKWNKEPISTIRKQKWDTR